MAKSIETGYEQPVPDKDETLVSYELEHFPNQYAAQGVNAVVKRNGETVGMIRVGSLEELDWLRRRLNGTFDPGNYNLGISDPA